MQELKADNGKQRRFTLSLLPQQAFPANCSNLFPSLILELPKETISSLWKNYGKTFKRLFGDSQKGTAGPEKDSKAQFVWKNSQSKRFKRIYRTSFLHIMVHKYGKFCKNSQLVKTPIPYYDSDMIATLILLNFFLVSICVFSSRNFF